jgi:hypothetical protein
MMMMMMCDKRLRRHIIPEFDNVIYTVIHTPKAANHKTGTDKPIVCAFKYTPHPNLTRLDENKKKEPKFFGFNQTKPTEPTNFDMGCSHDKSESQNLLQFVCV